MSDEDQADPPPEVDHRAARTHVVEAGMINALTARGLLGTSTADVAARVTGGQLDGLHVAGELYLYRDQVTDRAIYEQELSVRQLLSAAEVAEHMLTAYLAARPVTASLDEAQATGRPLITAARGRSDRSSGLARHGVLVHVPTLVGYVSEAITDGGTEGSRWSQLPAGDRLADLLCHLAGVSRQSNATPLSGEGLRRVHGWLRVDPTERPPTIPDDVWPLITGRPAPVGAEGPAGTGAAAEDPWADVTTDVTG